MVKGTRATSVVAAHHACGFGASQKGGRHPCRYAGADCWQEQVLGKAPTMRRGGLFRSAGQPEDDQRGHQGGVTHEGPAVFTFSEFGVILATLK